jgi:hypothetical protein
MDTFNLQNARRITDSRLRERDAVLLALKTEKVAKVAAEARVGDCEEARLVAQTVAQGVQTSANTQIAGIVTRCLAAVFDDPYEFKIEFSQKRGRTEAKLLFERDGVQVDPLEQAGGGVVDVASFALRLSCILLSRPPLRRVMFLDEPAKFISLDALPKFRALLERLADELGFQFFIVTHLKPLQFSVALDLGES